MRRALGAAVMWFAVGCGGGGTAAIDGGADDAAPVTCRQLAEQLRARTATISTACQTSSDCTAVGYPVGRDGIGTCNCGAAYATSCGGIPTNRDAWDSDATVVALEADWFARCVPMFGPNADVPGICDCSVDFSSIDCVNGRCYADPNGLGCAR